MARSKSISKTAKRLESLTREEHLAQLDHHLSHEVESGYISKRTAARRLEATKRAFDMEGQR
jgi:hypothetical protein